MNKGNLSPSENFLPVAFLKTQEFYYDFVTNLDSLPYCTKMIKVYGSSLAFSSVSKASKSAFLCLLSG